MALLLAALLVVARPSDPEVVEEAAKPVPTATVAAAEEAGVDPMDLQGAANTMGMDPRAYLRSEGLLDHPPAQPPPPVPPPVVVATPFGVFDLLAECEASGIWSNASNPKYKGGLQMDATFWRNYGGLAFAPAPHLATREQQIIVAQRGQKVQGWGAWPVCSRRLGLR